MSPSPFRLLYCGDVQTDARLLRDAGHEVVLLAPGVTGPELAAVAVQEDVDVVAVADPELGAAAAAYLDAGTVVFWITSTPGPSQPAEPRD